MRLASSIACGLISLWLGTDPEVHSRPARLTLLDRQISQQNGRWLVRYQTRYEGSRRTTLSSSDISVDYEAWVANSRSRPHSVPRKSQVQFALAEGHSVLATVIPSSNERHRCRERVSLAITTGNKPAAEFPAPKSVPISVDLTPGQIVWLYLTIDHEHFLHGTYDPLLGERRVEIRLGPCVLTDSLPLGDEHAPAAPAIKLSTPPKERLDSRQFHSAPDSLYLAADVPGYQYFRFDDMPIRYGTTFRLSFWYLIGVGTEGSCHVRLMEYQDTPNAWYRLEGGCDEQLMTQGRWKRFDQTFHTLPDTTTMALDFRIVGANVGEMWIDDIELVPLYSDAAKP